MLTTQEVTKYQQIYKKVFGEEISEEEARKQGTNLIELYKTVYRPLPSNNVSGRTK